jgi:hypothetical protein
MAPQKGDYTQQTGAANEPGTASNLNNLANLFANLTRDEKLKLVSNWGVLPANTPNPQPYIPVPTGERLGGKPRLTVLFPPCSNELLALINTQDTDEITKHFKEYFPFRETHRLWQGSFRSVGRSAG